MSSMRAVLMAFAMIIGATSLATPPPAPTDPNAALETVEVIARREKMRQAIASYVANITRFDGENVGRWRLPICVSVTGPAPAHADFLRARIVSIAESVGAPSDRNQRECTPNLYVILTSQPDQLWANLKRQHPGLFSHLPPHGVKRSLGTRPVQTIQNVILNNADGTTPSTSADYRLRDSRIRASVTEDFTTAVIVVNDAETGLATFGQLADYVALVALARVDLSADFAGTDSILRLFAAPAAEGLSHARLTEWDRSFLSALYGVDISGLRPRKRISNMMFQSLLPE